MKKYFFILLLTCFQPIFSQVATISVVWGSNPGCIGSAIRFGAQRVGVGGTSNAPGNWYVNNILVATNRSVLDLTINNASSLIYFTDGIQTQTSFQLIGQTFPQALSNLQGPTVVCEGQTLTYTVTNNSNINQYIWSYPNGFSGTTNTSSGTNQGIVSNISSQSGYITVTGRNSCGTNSFPTSLYVNVNPSLTNNGTISGLTSVCQGQNSVTYTVPSITNADSYIWTLPNGATGTSTSNTITVNYGYNATSGNISVNGRNICGTDGAVLSLPVNVNSISIPSATNNSPVCLGNTLSLSTPNTIGATYLWTGPNGFTSTQQNPIVSTNTLIGMGGSYNVATTINGCTSQTGTTNAIINQATINSNSPICEGSMLSLSASTIPGASYFWTGPNGYSSTEQNPTVSTNATSAMEGLYSVYTTANNCTSPTPTTTSVVINLKPVVTNTSSNSPVCLNNMLSLSTANIIGATYSWTGPNGFTSTQQNPTVSTSATTAMSGLYNVIATVNGCSSNAGITNVEINKIIAGNNGSVCVGNLLILSATSITGAVYSWIGPNGFTSNQQNPTVSTNATTAMGGVYSVTSTVNGCTSSPSVTIVSINPAVSLPTVTTPVTYCQNATASQLTAIGNNLLWYTSATGGLGSSTAPTPDTSNSGSTTYYVSQTSGCESARAAINFIVNPLPENAGSILGTTILCQGQNAVIYSVPTIANATSYIWSLPNGVIGNSTTNNITVDFGLSSISGNISVQGLNSCGNGIPTTLPIIVNPLPSNAGVISGATTVCQGQNSVTYTVPTIANATSYIWTLPNGATGSSSTNSIAVDYGAFAVTGGIQVYGQSTCGNGNASIIVISVNSYPDNAGTISGLTTICQGQSSVTYSVPTILNATSYIWTLPSGANGFSSTNSITINYSSTAISGNLSVKGNNSCGDGVLSYLPILVNPLPSNAGTISGISTVCQGQNDVNYAVPTILNATSYIWTFPTGVTGTSTSNIISLSYGLNAISGNITVKGVNSCNNGGSSTIAINVNNTPNTPIISQTGNMLNSDASSGNQWYNQNGPIDNAVSQNYNFVSDGSYYVIVTNSNGCSATSNILNTIFLDANNYEIDNIIKLYPNPVQSFLHIELEKQFLGKITDLTGKILLNVNTKDIDVSSLSAGIYILNIVSDGKIYYKKIIKK